MPAQRLLTERFSRRRVPSAKNFINVVQRLQNFGSMTRIIRINNNKQERTKPT